MWSGHISRLHFSRESTGSMRTSPRRLLSGPSACWSSSVSGQMENVEAVESHTRHSMRKRNAVNTTKDMERAPQGCACVAVPGRYLSTHIRSGAPDWRSCEASTSWMEDQCSRSGPAPPPGSLQSWDCRAGLDKGQARKQTKLWLHSIFILLLHRSALCENHPLYAA